MMGLPNRPKHIDDLPSLVEMTDDTRVPVQQGEGEDSHTYKALGSLLKTYFGGGGTVPTGTGFVHVVSGVQDTAARAVDLSGADVTGLLPNTSVNGLTGLITAAITAFSLTLGSAALADTGDFDAAGTAASAVAALSAVYQPLDADLTAIAALTSAANKVPYSTGAGAWAMADLTAAGRSLVAGADAAAQRTTLGLGALSTVTPGTGVATAAAVNVGSAGAFIINGGALGTPASGVATNLTGTAAGLTAGNATLAAAATVLATPRTINGVAFDGSAAITVAAAAGTLTGTTLAANVVSSSLTSAAGGVFGTAAYTEASAYDASGSAAAALVSANAYTDAAVVGLLDFKGNTDASANPNYPVGLKGDAYYISVAGKVGGASGKSVEVGDVYVASADNAGGTEASAGTSWFVMEHNLVGAAVTSGTLAQFSATTSAQLAGVISDETGSGALVFANTPTLISPLLGTPTSGVLTNCTGLPLSSVTGLGTGIATALAINTGSAGAPVLFNGAGGTPSSLTLTNATGLPATGLSGSITAAQGPPALADGATLGFAAFAAADFNAAAGVISLDYTNAQAADASHKGFLTAADWTTFNGKGTGTVTSIATTSPISGGTIAGTGTISLLTNVDFAFAAAQSVTKTINATSADGLLLTNTTAAAAGAQQWSPRLHFTGQGWKTNSTAASQTVDWIAEVQPVQGAAAPTANLVFSPQIGGGGYTNGIYFSSAAGTIGTANASLTLIAGVSNRLFIQNTSAQTAIAFLANSQTITLQSGGVCSWTSSATDAFNAADLFLSRGGAAATLQQGAANAASPVAQTLQAQGSRAGTDTNIGGANYTHSSGLGTGTGTLSSLILASPIAVASGTGAQTMTTGLAIKAGAAVLTSYLVANLPAAATAGAGATAFVTDALTPVVLSAVVGGGAVKTCVYSDGTNWIVG